MHNAIADRAASRAGYGSLPRHLPAGFIAPCLPTAAPQPPSGPEWLHEIKHASGSSPARMAERVRLSDLADRFPMIVEALARLRASSCIIDGEALACGEDGIASFERMRDWRQGDSDCCITIDHSARRTAPAHP